MNYALQILHDIATYTVEQAIKFGVPTMAILGSLRLFGLI